MRVLITGANGFVGRALTPHLLARGRAVRAAVRNRSADLPSAAEQVIVGDLSQSQDWSVALQEVDTVIHLAARVHQMRETADDVEAAYRKANCDATLALARAAAQAGCRRFVFLSSIKVNGERTTDVPFRADDVAAPDDAYGRSKLDAEVGLRTLSRETGMEVVIIRPPLIYGPGVKANFRSMMRWLHKGVPLPLGAIRNRRSFLALDNLVDLLDLCITHPGAAGRTFLASDGEDLSTTELLQRMGSALGRPARLLPVPESVLRAGAGILGRSQAARRLCDSLQLDINETRTALGWNPPFGIDECFRRTADSFLQDGGGR